MQKNKKKSMEYSLGDSSINNSIRAKSVNQKIIRKNNYFEEKGNKKPKINEILHKIILYEIKKKFRNKNKLNEYVNHDLN